MITTERVNAQELEVGDHVLAGAHEVVRLVEDLGTRMAYRRFRTYSLKSGGIGQRNFAIDVAFTRIKEGEPS